MYNIYLYIHYNMFQDDFLNQVETNYVDDNENDPNQIFEKTKRMDKGYNFIYRNTFRKNGKSYKKKYEIYTSGVTGNHIRDAESGEYFNYKIGSHDEDLFFKVSLATGECKSANGFSTLFYMSPQHYENHLQGNISPTLVAAWEKKRDARLIHLKSVKDKMITHVDVR